jgi:hypothetical protein
MNILDTTSPGHASNRAGRNSSSLRYASVFGGVLLAGLLATGVANRWLDPLNFNPSFQRKVAAQLQSGSNYALRDPNLDFRGLRREHIRLMPATPDVIIFAGSRFELATKDLFPGRAFYNGFVHSDYVEDLLAFVDLLQANNRLPRTLVLSVRFATFLPVDARDTEEWKMFWPEYRAMADRLGLEKVPLMDNLPWRHWIQLVSLDALKRQAEAHLAPGPVPGPTGAASLAGLDVLRADGSLGFSMKHQGTFTAESSRADATTRAAKVAKKATWPIDPQRVAILGTLLKYLREQNVQVAIAITPHHPAYWAGVANAPYGRALATVEAEVGRIAAAGGATLVGSFDPGKAGCQESSFRDYIHLDETCLKAVFDQIPSPPVRSASALAPRVTP